MIKLYGVSASRAYRNLWLLEELGLAYEHIPQDYRNGASQNPEFLAINPNGRIPALVDAELVLFESMAINLYLASRYGTDTPLWSSDPAGQGLTYQWSFWVMSEVEHALLSVLMHSRVLPQDKRDAQSLSRNSGCLKLPFAVLDKALADREYLLGNTFSVADLNVAAVLSWARLARFDLQPFPNLNRWLEACLARPANRKAFRLP